MSRPLESKQGWAPRRHPSLPPLRRRDEMTERGAIKFFDRSRGYGFIARAGASDVFLHQSIASRYGMRQSELEKDAPVRFVSKDCDGRRPECVAIAAG